MPKSVYTVFFLPAAGICIPKKLNIQKSEAVPGMAHDKAPLIEIFFCLLPRQHRNFYGWDSDNPLCTF